METVEINVANLEITEEELFELQEAYMVDAAGEMISKATVKTIYAFDDVMALLGKKDTLFQKIKKETIRVAKAAKNGDPLAIAQCIGLTIMTAATVALAVLNFDYLKTKVKEIGTAAGKLLGTIIKKFGLEEKFKDLNAWLVKMMGTVGIFLGDIQPKIKELLKTMYQGVLAGYNKVMRESAPVFQKFLAKLGIRTENEVEIPVGESTTSEKLAIAGTIALFALLIGLISYILNGAIIGISQGYFNGSIETDTETMINGLKALVTTISQTAKAGMAGAADSIKLLIK